MHIEGTIMATTTIKAVFHSNIQDVWNVVTSLKNYQWRSDLSFSLQQIIIFAIRNLQGN